MNHREVGVHTKSFASALRGALREDPDIVLVGEMRDLETIELALMVAASDGPLSSSARSTRRAPPKTIDRIIDVFPGRTSKTRCAPRLSESLKGVVAQNLFKPHRQTRPRRRARECSSFDHRRLRTSIREAKTHQIPGMIQVGKKMGNQPLDDAIMEHLRMKRISPEEAYEKSIDKKKFRPFLAQPPDDDDNP